VPTHNQFLYDASTAGPGPYPTPSADVLVSAGAFTNVDVDVPPQIASSMSAAGQTIPAAASGLALLDTGATLTCVHEPLLTGMGLNPVGVVTSGTAAGQQQQSLYVARLTFPLLGWTADLQVVGVDLTGQQVATAPPPDIIALLGWNLFMNWTLVWNGPGGFWSIST
jgi:hypothetical protein